MDTLCYKNKDTVRTDRVHRRLAVSLFADGRLTGLLPLVPGSPGPQSKIPLQNIGTVDPQVKESDRSDRLQEIGQTDFKKLVRQTSHFYIRLPDIFHILETAFWQMVSLQLAIKNVMFISQKRHFCQV